MNRWSYLDADQLKLVCDEYIELLNADINDISNSQDNLRSVLCFLEGPRGESTKMLCEEARDIRKRLEYAIKADEQDIYDFQTLKSKLDKNYDGNKIFTLYDNAHKRRDEYNEKAADERRKAAAFNPVIRKILPSGVVVEERISNPHEENARIYQKIADDSQKEMDIQFKKMMEFDTIERETSRLFVKGMALRDQGYNVWVEPRSPYDDDIPKGDVSIGIPDFPDEIADGIVNPDIIKGKVKRKVTITKSGWLIDNADRYGLTEMEARYIEEYYPTLANSLYGLSQTDHQGYIDLTIKDIKNTLRDDYFYMMEDYGYSYEAISYLLENNPSLISALDSHYGPSSIPDARMDIYNYLIGQGICVYDPVYDFDEYNVRSGMVATGEELQFHTNCYAYAFGITRDPRTGELLPEGGLQPGYFSGKEIEYYKEWEDIYSSDESNDGSLLVKYIEADAAALGLKFEEYHEGMTGGVRVALVIDPINFADEIPDYHWYHYDE